MIPMVDSAPPRLIEHPGGFEVVATRDVMRFMLALLQQSAAGAARVIADAESRAVLQELRNKVEAFYAFEHVDSLVGIPMESPLWLLVERAAALPPPLCVWAAEGVGYHVTAALCAHRTPRYLLRDGCLPERSLVPLHAGMGSAIATALVHELSQCPARGIARVLADFEAACEVNSDPEHRGVALEALGFTVQSMFGDLLPTIAPVLKGTEVSLAPFFWHGVGRAMYFAPVWSLATMAVRVRNFQDQLQVPITERVNALAGYSWAATLVNLRDPSVLEPLVQAAVATCTSKLACGIGVHSALEVWRRCAPGDPALARFSSHVPDSSGARHAWQLVIDASPRPRVDHAGDLFGVRPDLYRGGNADE
jgi:hypothetical protein